MLYADIIVNISHENLDKTYSYAIPPEYEKDAVIGAQVYIPFGAGNRQIKGFIIGLSNTPKYDPSKTKPIIKVMTDGVVLETHFIKLAYWIREHYGATMNESLRTVLPVKKTVSHQEKKWIHFCLSKEEAQQELKICQKKNYKARVRFLEQLIKEETIEFQTAVNKLNIGRDVIKKFQENKWISITSKMQYRNPIKEDLQREKIKWELNQGQRTAADRMIDSYKKQKQEVYLLHGITGSGKTEVYMEVIENVVASGRQVIMLIPEIALTYQTVMRFYKRFGERISILHSRLSGGERYDQYIRAQNGEIDIMIGPRSALFTPFQNLGLIILDEEHEESYKSETPPKYHAREVAIERAKMTNAMVILGSATPSVESYKNALDGTYQLCTLTERAGKGTIPTVEIVDLREELKKRNRSMFSDRLKILIADRLQKGQQIMLFINRRGYAGFVSCRSCGFVLKCPHCDVSLTAHQIQKGQKLVCHYCGHTIIKPSICPSCSSKYIASFGTGTQKIEEAVGKEFPQARVLRMDTDTTKGKEGHEKILSAFANHQADILVGTQMIVKGHDFPNVTLVGIMAADLSLFANDYRAAEKTFQLLNQASGRAGRGKEAGEVVIQTYQPEHYSIVTAAKNDYLSFYKQEIVNRSLIDYPPMGHMFAVLLTSKKEELAEKLSKELIKSIFHYAQSQGIFVWANKKYLQKEWTIPEKNQDNIKIIGPAKASVGKIKDYYRIVFYLKGKEEKTLRLIKNHLEYEMETRFEEEKKKVSVQFDFDPVHSY